MRVNLQPSFILHYRAYRDTSLLLDVLTVEYGRISIVARGARGSSRRGSRAALLQSFNPLFVSFSGRSELKTLTSVEAAGRGPRLSGERLYSAMYLNELLVRLMHRNDPHPTVFGAYSSALEALATEQAADAVLRRFELALLEELGYSFDFSCDGLSGEAVDAGGRYYFDPDYGLVAWQGDGQEEFGRAVREEGRESGLPRTGETPQLYSGAHLLAMYRGEFEGDVRLAARRLLRQVLAVHLGGEPLRSRELFRRHSMANKKGASR